MLQNTLEFIDLYSLFIECYIFVVRAGFIHTYIQCVVRAGFIHTYIQCVL